MENYIGSESQQSRQRKKERDKTQTKLVKSLLYSSFRKNSAIKWGTPQEPQTKQAYFATKKISSPNLSVHNSGFVIHSSHNWIGTSPDGIVNDPSSTNPEGVIEYKNPYSAKELSIHDAVSQEINSA